ncbi:MAG: cobalt-precorrin-5B (C(1))-methyltransferase [Syntrophaceticus schinkii]
MAIADILAMQPEVLICDEPTAWLDVKHARHVMEILTRCNGRGVTVIISTHDVEMAYSWADYIFVMKDGRVIGEGAPLEIFDDAELLKDAELARPLLYVLSGELVAKGCCDEGAPAKSVQELMKRIRDLNNCSPMSSGGNSYRWHKGKLLRRGYTTGTSAAAAGRAAVLVLKGEHPEQVEVLLPEGNYLNIEIAGIERCGNEAKAWVIKDGGDDPDITDGARIEVTARFLEEESSFEGARVLGWPPNQGWLFLPARQRSILYHCR